jgi:MFS family permease
MTVTANAPARIAVLVAVLLCSYAIALETTVVSAAIPTVIAGFGGLSDLSWVFSAYLIAQAVSMPLFGSASDRIGRKRCYVFAAALFFLGTLACGLARDMLSLTVFRVLQGIGAGGLITVGTAALNDIIPQASRGKYQAMGSAVWGIAAISGPVVGSVIMQFLDWRYIFWINLPIVVVSAALLSVFYRERGSVESAGKFAVMPSLYMCVSLLALMAALVHGQTMSSLQWAICVTTGGLAAALLVAVQRRGADPLVPMDLLRMKIVLLAAASAFLCGAISMGLTVYVPSFVALILHADYLTISSTVAVMTLTWTFSGILVGLLLKSGHYRVMATLAAGVILSGALGLCYAAKNSAGTELVLISSGVLGLGLGACSVIFSVALQSAVSDTVRGVATSLFYLCRVLGQSIGVALCGGVLASSDPLARALMKQQDHTDPASAGQAVAEAAAMAGTIRSEFVAVFALIALVAVVQLLFSIYTPKKALTA